MDVSAGMVGTITDITQRKKMEEALAENKEKYRALTENTGAILFSVDMTGRFTHVSSQINKYGFLANEVIGKRHRDFIHPEDVDDVELNLARDLEIGAQFHSEFRIFDKWGNTHWLDEKGTLRLDQSGKPLGIYGVLRDDSERKRAEEAPTELKNLYMAIFDNTGSAMIIIGQDSSLILANPVWAVLTRISRVKSVGRRWTDFIYPEDLELLKKDSNGSNENFTRTNEYSFRIIDAVKNVYHCLVSIVVIPGTTNSIVVIVDITERKRAKETKPDGFIFKLFEDNNLRVAIELALSK